MAVHMPERDLLGITMDHLAGDQRWAAWLRPVARQRSKEWTMKANEHTGMPWGAGCRRAESASGWRRGRACWRTVLVLAIVILAGALLPAGAPADNLSCPCGSLIPGTLSDPAVYIDYWGSDWSGVANFGAYRTYLEYFLSNIGGGNFLATQGQYGAGNPAGLLKGTWQDSNPFSPVPQTPGQGDIALEAERAADHFFPPPPLGADTYNPQAVLLIALPPGKGDTTFGPKGGPACAWHSQALYDAPYGSLFTGNFDAPIRTRLVAYINLPYQPDGGTPCRQNWVNPSNDPFGHGTFDGVSTVASHEYAETVTDPFLNGGWRDSSGNETGDKCNSQLPPANNVLAGQTFFAVQGLWSNAAASGAGACVLGAAPHVQVSTSSIDFGGMKQSIARGSPPLVVQNTGDADLHGSSFYPFPSFSSWTLSGPNANDFFLTGDTCTAATLHPIATGPSSCQVNVTFTPTDVGPRTATLELDTDDPGPAPQITLTGTGLSPLLIIRLAPSQVQFPGTLRPSLCGTPSISGIGDFSCPRSLPVILSNSDALQHQIQSVAIGGTDPADFVIASNGCSGITLLAAGANSCQIDVTLVPSRTGERTAVLMATDDAGNDYVVPLDGVGVGPTANFSASTLVFDNARIGRTTAPQSLVITNSSRFALNSVVSVSGDFSLAGNDCSTVPAASACSIPVTLTARHGGHESGTLTLTDDANDSPQQVRLSGTGIAPFASLAPDALSFVAPAGGSGAPGQSAQTKLTNLGTAPLMVGPIAASGDFTQSNDCPPDLKPNGASCTITVTFRPTTPGASSGALSVSDDAIHSPQTIPLSGTGFAWPTTGAFVVGNQGASTGSTATFWGAQWAKGNTLSGGSVPDAFKGFAASTSPAPPACGGTWSAGPANSSQPPPGPLPAYLGVVFTHAITQSGSTLSGDVLGMAVVTPDPGYAADDGHAGTGKIVAVYHCQRP